MSSAAQNDVLAELIVRDVPSHIRASMTEEQIKAIKSAIAKSAENQRHTVDIRFVLPLFFTKCYFVFLAGKDTRSSTMDVEDDRRAKAGLHLSGTGIVIAVAVLLMIALVLLYTFKSRSGINLFDGHLSDFLPFLK